MTNTPQTTAIELVNALAQNETDHANVLAKLRGKTAEVGVLATRIAELERQIVAKDKASAIVNDEVIALKVTIARLELELHPVPPVGVLADTTPHLRPPAPTPEKHMTAAESRAQDRADERAEDEADAKAAARAQATKHK